MDGFLVVSVLLALLVGAVAGAAICFALSGARQRRRQEALRAELEEVSSSLHEANAALAAAETESRMLTDQLRQLDQRSARDASVLQALAPVAEKLNQVQQQVGLLERDRLEQYGQLVQQLQEARESDRSLLSTTESLASALRSNSTRGTWGEVQLRRVVEAAGMLPYVDFQEQVALSAADGGGRPDMVVRLPGRKELVLDAKVPLSSFLSAQEIPDSADELGLRRRQDLLAAHAKALRSHVDALGQKRYWEGMANSPELVVCFIPVESVLSAALQADPALLDYAFKRNVALASPVTLLAVLKGVAFSWRQEVLTENAKELFDLSRQLYDRLGTMGDHVSKLGSSLKSSVERYNSFVGTLESRVLPTARRINAFDPAALDGAAQGPAPAPVESTPRLLSSPELVDGRREAG